MNNQKLKRRSTALAIVVLMTTFTSLACYWVIGIKCPQIPARQCPDGEPYQATCTNAQPDIYYPATTTTPQPGESSYGGKMPANTSCTYACSFTYNGNVIVCGDYTNNFGTTLPNSVQCIGSGSSGGGQP